MGSFYLTCGLSNLPILPDQPVIALMIQEQDLGEDGVEPTDPWERWSPSTMLLRGHYADYGRVDLDAPSKEKLILTREDSCVRITLAGMETIEPFPLRAFSKLEKSASRYHALWLAHAGLFDDLCHNMTTYFQFDAMSVHEAVEKAVLKIIPPGIPASQRQRFDFTYSGRMTCPAAWTLNNMFEYEKEQSLPYRSVELWKELHALYRIQATLRKSLEPCIGWGSQDQDTKPYLDYADAIKRQIARMGEEE